MGSVDSKPMNLHTLKPSAGSTKNKKRLGRGHGSGTGKTAGKGHKGQKARTGGTVHPWFEGGQMPLYRRLPNIGFRSKQKRLGKNQYRLVSLDNLSQFEDGSVVDAAALQARGISCSKWQAAGFKVVCNGAIDKKVNVKLQAVTAGARAAIEAAGGAIEITK